MIDHELVYDAAGNLVRVDVVGDLNCDGEVTFDDLDAFMLALTDPSGYAQAHSDCRLLLGDVDGDGDMDFDDIDYWVALVGVSAVAADRYEYDHENRLTGVRGPDGVLKLRIWYDALGRRILSETYDASGDPVTTTRHIYDGLAAIVEFECAGAAAPIGEPNGCGDGSQPVLAREFIWGDRFPEPLVLIDHTDAGDVPAGQPEHLYVVHDALGSVVGLTNDPAALDALDPNYPGAGGSGGGSGSGGSGGGTGGGSGGGTGGGAGGGAGIMPALVERYDYDPYGATYIAYRLPSTYDDASETRDPDLLTDPAAWQPCESSRFGNPFLWTAQRYDPGVRLCHFLFRTYSPTLGRWMQRDPAGYVDGVSLYEYVRISPVTWLDREGLARDQDLGGRAEEKERRRKQREADEQRRRPVSSPRCPPGSECPDLGDGIKGRPRKPNDPEAPVNGCTLSPDRPAGFDFTEACNQHDRCDGTPGKTKQECDDELYSDMLKVCSSYEDPNTRARCNRWAETYYVAVLRVGGPAYRGAQQEAAQRASANLPRMPVRPVGRVDPVDCRRHRPSA
ncbi:MAG: hypothetical protein IPM13_09105 [Phycisphaerales bacterium]|nr:hypothetical protein [Phycisphaerales bacterium]